MHPVFRTARKDDRRRCAYLGPDGSVVVLFERTELGQRLEYAKVALFANVRVSWHNFASPVAAGALARVVLHEYGGLGAVVAAVSAAGTKALRIEAWFNNSTDKTREQGLTMETLSFDSPTFGNFSLSQIDGMTSGGFALQGPGSRSRFPSSDATVQTWEWLSTLSSYGEAPIIARYPSTDSKGEVAA